MRRCFPPVCFLYQHQVLSPCPQLQEPPRARPETNVLPPRPQYVGPEVPAVPRPQYVGAEGPGQPGVEHPHAQRRDLPSPTPPSLPIIPAADLRFVRALSEGSFGTVALMELVLPEQEPLPVAVKCNGTNCADVAAIDNERKLYEKLNLSRNTNVMPVYGICTDNRDGQVRLVMKFCEKGSVDVLLKRHAPPLVGVAAAPPTPSPHF
jgi:hypothetical protein